MERKTRSDAKLGTLPEDRQSVIADYARTHSLAETLAWLRADVWTATQRLNLDRESAKTRFEFEREKIELRKQAEARSQEKLQFEREKWITESCRKILAAATDQRAKDIAELSVSNEEKIKLLRKTYFADVDELEKSGEVQIPK